MPGRVHVGTSGYVYRHWRGVFYPPGLPTSAWLSFYARHFSTVELNATFYRLPSPEAVRRWRGRVPLDFAFACKGSRYLTHMKRLLDTRRGLTRFFTPLRHLRERFAVALWQLPPQMDRPDPARLDAFLGALPKGQRHAVEFRDASWYVGEVWDVLERHGAALCEHDLLPRPASRPRVPFRYLRFHGADAKYAGRYGRARLSPWAEQLATARTDAYVYFNNDGGGAAVQDALDLLDLVGQPAVYQPPGPGSHPPVRVNSR